MTDNMFKQTIKFIATWLILIIVGHIVEIILYSAVYIAQELANIDLRSIVSLILGMFLSSLLRKIDHINQSGKMVDDKVEDKLYDAEEIIGLLASGYQSRKRYNELISMANKYMEKYYNE